MLLEVDGLGFSYADHQVLDSVSFRVKPGETIAVLGPNGVGKSTLFRCILGFLDSYKGSVLLGGDDIRKLDSKETARRIAYIPQISSPVFDFTVMELVLMGLASQLPLFESPDAADERRALEVLEDVGIGHLAYCPSGQISGGEYQLALMARALLQQAQVLVMDEPTANLDYGNQFRVMERMSCLATSGYSVIYSAHDPNQVLMHASRVLVLQAGRLIADGAPREVMTGELLSSLYGVNVQRVDVVSASGGLGEHAGILIAGGASAYDSGALAGASGALGALGDLGDSVVTDSLMGQVVSLCYPYSGETKRQGRSAEKDGQHGE